MKFFRKRRGYSLLEASIVLALVGTVTAAIWTAMDSTKKSAVADSLVQQTRLTVRNVRNYFSSRAMPTLAADITTNYTTAVLRAAGVFPENMCPANCVSGSVTTIYNAYGGTTTFALPDADADTLPDANQFSLTFNSVLKRGCVEMGQKMTTSSSTLGLVSFKIGANAAITSFPITPATLDTQCSGLAAGNTLVLVFSIRN